MGEHPQLRLAILISGAGSNLLAIACACESGQIDARIVLVVADRDAPGIAAAAQRGLATRVLQASGPADRAAFERALEQALQSSGAELIVLAGFMRILSADFVQRHTGRLLNIHPSLLPRHKGLHTHRRVLQAGEREHGASVHYVTAELDGGPVICQARLAVRPEDTEASLRARVQQLEHRIYPYVIGLIAAGRLRLDGASIRLDGQVLEQPLTMESYNDAHPQP